MEKQVKITRNASIELLRNLAMLFIVILHLLGKTGAIDELKTGTAIWAGTWVLSAICRMGNNIFVIISGYFYKENKFKFHKLMNMWFTVWLYSVGITIGAKYILGLELASGFRRVLFPIANGEYWFMTVYIGLYCFMPYIKLLLEHLTVKLHRGLLVICLLFFSMIPTVFRLEEWLNSGGGYGIVWFIFLYMLGAYIRDNDLSENRMFLGAKKWWWCLLILLPPLYMFGLEFLRGLGVEHYILDGYTGQLFAQNSPIVLLASVAMVICFADMNIKNVVASKVITFLGSGCLGVYLIHNNRNISHFLWEKLRINYWLGERENLFVILLIAVAVFMVCNFIDHLRMWVFKILKIDKLIVKFGNWVSSRVCSKEA